MSDQRAVHGGRARRSWWTLLAVAALVGLFGLWLVWNRNVSSGPTVILYTSQDQQYVEPILKQFTRQSGIRVRTVFDSEAVKTVGLANRLLAETNHPQSDVWWSNEELRTRQLAERGVFRETNGWAAFGFRSRRMVVNTNLFPLASIPLSLLELTNERWRGKVALAYPMFGTTSTHFLTLRQHWGAEHWRAWCRALAANRPFLVDGNSVVVKLVGRGEAVLGLTDSDDIAAGRREGLPVAAGPMTGESLLVPNTVAVIRGGPHPAEAQQLFEFLRGPDTLSMLVSQSALEGATPGRRPHLHVRWDAALADLETATEEMKTIFLR